MKKIVILCLLALTSVAVYAQPEEVKKMGRREMRERRLDSLIPYRRGQEQIQAKKIGYLTNKIDLTPEEAQMFWPIYNSYWAKRDSLFEKRRQIMRDVLRSKDRPDEERAELLAQKLVDNQMAEAKLFEEYHKQFQKVLSPQKVLKYYAAEESFKTKLLDDLRKPE
ncbi:MAG: Spy/CpxP family protein refolding chaperone [Prevotellaceae bacterium]|nr:Spy/CpxP family protein refolding chaperone [Prevotellaceae bacterium]